MNVVVCDVGLGNLRSVERALVFAAHREGIAADVRITADPDAIRRADKIVMPGQGAFRDCAVALADGLGEVVKERIRAGAPYLGICLGLQVLFATSDEAPGATGLGVLPGTVRRLPQGIDPVTGAPLKIPHIGWNTASLGPAAAGSSVARLEAPEYFYFVHSYVVVPDDPAIVAATTDYGSAFVSAVAKDNVFACQFHPEKSQEAGLAFLTRFLTG